MILRFENFTRIPQFHDVVIQLFIIIIIKFNSFFDTSKIPKIISTLKLISRNNQNETWLVLSLCDLK